MTRQAGKGRRWLGRADRRRQFSVLRCILQGASVKGQWTAGGGQGGVSDEVIDLSARVSPGQNANQHLTMAPLQTYPVFTIKGEEDGFLPSPFWQPLPLEHLKGAL